MAGTFFGAAIAAYLTGITQLTFSTGSIVGGKIAHRLPQKSLRKGFGIFLIVMGLYILIRSAPEALGL
jgi:uncharacterized membrane protein YfcA